MIFLGDGNDPTEILWRIAVISIGARPKAEDAEKDWNLSFQPVKPGRHNNS
jgi:hypothetical protein